MSSTQIYSSYRTIIIAIVLMVVLFSHQSSVYATNAVVGDLVWEDINANGLQDPGERGISGVRIILYKANRERFRETTSDSNGRYVFSFIPPEGGEDYYLGINPDDFGNLFDVKGYVVTSRGNPREQTRDIDSDFDQLEGKTGLFRLPRIQANYLYFDLGLIKIPECSTPLDIMISLDFSHYVSGVPNHYRYMTNFARAIARGFTIGTQDTLLGVTQFNRINPPNSFLNSQVVIPMNWHLIRQNLTQAINQISPPLNDNRNLNLVTGLNLSADHLRTNGRIRTPDVIIMVTDADHSKIRNPGNPINTAKTIKDQMTQIFFIQLDPPPNLTSQRMNEINSFAQSIPSPPLVNHLFRVNGDQTRLMGVLVSLLNQVCNYRVW